MGEVVDLHGQTSHLDNDELVADLARFADGTLSEKAVKSRHRLTNAEWAALGEDDSLVRAIEAEKLRRLRSGQTKRERAQNEIVDAPPILAGIMRDPNANERHRIDSVKALDALATGGPEAAAAGTHFSIVINLGADGHEHVERYSKTIAPNPNDEPDDNNPDDTISRIPLAAITKKKDDGGGQGYL